MGEAGRGKEYFGLRFDIVALQFGNEVRFLGGKIYLIFQDVTVESTFGNVLPLLLVRVPDQSLGKMGLVNWIALEVDSDEIADEIDAIANGTKSEMF